MWRGILLTFISLAAAGPAGAPAGLPCGRDVENLAPEFSPAGDLVVFVSGGGGGCSSYGELRIAAGGGGPSRSLAGRIVASVMAGRYLAYEGNDLYTVDPLGGGATLISPRRCPAAEVECREGTDLGDLLAARTRRSWLRGLAGHDRLGGGAGHDRIEGAFGDDEILGRGGNDHLFGGPGRDRIEGGPGDDWIDGGSGHDVLVTGSGRGRIVGGAGDDRIDARGRASVLACGEGLDRVFANAATPVARDCERVTRP